LKRRKKGLLLIHVLPFGLSAACCVLLFILFLYLSISLYKPSSSLDYVPVTFVIYSTYQYFFHWMLQCWSCLRSGSVWLYYYFFLPLPDVRSALSRQKKKTEHTASGDKATREQHPRLLLQGGGGSVQQPTLVDHALCLPAMFCCPTLTRIKCSFLETGLEKNREKLSNPRRCERCMW
jgi:hypothetical protein